MFQWMVQGPAGPIPANRPPAPALEALAELPFCDRAAAAQSLAQQGYVLDAIVDVWGWNAVEEVMRQRRAYGYTWIPAVGMTPIMVAPGLRVPGLPSYDPDHPPLGAILIPEM